MRPPILLAALLGVPASDAFLCPSAAMAGLPGTKQRSQQLQFSRAIDRMALEGEGDMAGKARLAPREENAASTSSKPNGPFRLLRSLLGRKATTAAAVSVLLSFGTPGRAEALFGRGKASEVPAVAVLEQRAEEAVEDLAESGEGFVEDSEGALAAAAPSGESFPNPGIPSEEGVAAEGEEGADRIILSEEGLDGAEGGVTPVMSAAVAPRAQAKNPVVGALDSVRQAVESKPEMAAVVIAGAAGATFVVSRGAGGGTGRRRQAYGRSGRSKSGDAPRSPFAGIGKPRVSPEVAAADAKKKADSLKSANFDVDLELFGDAVSDLPARPPPPTPPAPEPAPSPSEAIQGAMAARDAGVKSDVPAGGETVAVDEPAGNAAKSPPIEALLEAEPASPAPPVVKAKEKAKRKGPMMNLFKRDTGPQRATTMDDAMAGETPDEAIFRQATAAVLARSAPAGVFSVDEPRLLAEATVTPVDGEGETGENAAESSRVAVLTQLMQAAGFSTKEAADVVADIVNAMVVRLVDTAASSKDDQSMSSASDALLSYMDGAGGVFAALCPGVELSPPIKYNGSFKKGKLEKVFEAAARNALKLGDESQMGKLDRLQDLFSIKEAKANSITQKIMMDLMMKMMSEGGGEDTEGLEKMMASMGGGGGMGGMPGMGAGRTPEDHKREVEALKAMVESGECPKEEVDGLRKMYKDAGMDIDQLVNDPMMESSMDADAKEVVVLLRKLLALWPKD